jgi:hypothetical protein
MHDPAALLEIATFVGVLRNSTVEPTMFQRSLSTQIDEIIEYLKSIKLGQSPKLPPVRPTKLRSFQHSPDA